MINLIGLKSFDMETNKVFFCKIDLDCPQKTNVLA